MSKLVNRAGLTAWCVVALAAGLVGTVHGADAERDALFGDDLPAGKASGRGAQSGSTGVKGYVQFELARTTADPDHWSKMRTRAELAAQGGLGEGVKWKLSARADYDAVYGINNFYQAEVERNQRANLVLRENYLDVSRGDWDFRIGRQHVVWGEMVGLFFADVVSARDLREFILPEFDAMRIPQWAVRSEYFKDDFHAEFLWVPVASYDQIGKPGAEFYPFQPQFPGTITRYQQERTPPRNLGNSNYGIRLSTLKGGWDISGFYYNSMDVAQTFYREVVGPVVSYQARHDRIHQMGGTLAKDFGEIVFKAEAVYTHGRKFGVLRFTDPDGVVPQDTLDWAAGLDFTLPQDSRLNVQLFQRVFFDHDPGIIPKRHENGYSVYLSSKLTEKLEAQALLISGFNREDWLFRPKLSWGFEKNWRLLVGADVFGGAPTGMFGRYGNKDRVFSELRYSF